VCAGAFALHVVPALLLLLIPSAVIARQCGCPSGLLGPLTFAFAFPLAFAFAFAFAFPLAFAFAFASPLASAVGIGIVTLRLGPGRF
jgi:hypothetical protein